MKTTTIIKFDIKFYNVDFASFVAWRWYTWNHLWTKIKTNDLNPVIIVWFQRNMRNFGWKKIRNFPARKRKTYHVPKENVMRFALTFKRKFPKFDIIRFYQKEFGQESPSPNAISRWLSRPPPSRGHGKIHTFSLWRESGNFKEFRCKKPNCPSFIIKYEDNEVPENEAEREYLFSVKECQYHK